MNGDTVYALGVICGIIATAIVVIIIKKLIWGKSNKYKAPKYDERQTLEQAKAGRVGMYVLMVFNMLAGLATLFIEDLPFSFFNLMLTGILLTITVYCCLCIWREAYFAINQSSKKWITFFLIIGVINIALGIFDNSFVNLLCGAMCAIVSITALIKKRLNDKEA